MMEAYDRVEWRFFEEMMRKMGFAEGWIRMIMRCVSTTRFSISLHGRSIGYVPAISGAPPGDPLLPCLFLFCVEGFSAQLRQAQREKQLAGVRFGASCPIVTHMLFVDDNTVCLEATEESLNALKNVMLQVYE
jgi:hypothetical protein